MFPPGKYQIYFKEMLRKYEAGQASPEEERFISLYMDWLDMTSRDAFEREGAAAEDREALRLEIKARLMDSIRQVFPDGDTFAVEKEEGTAVRALPRRSHRWGGWWAAASVLVVLGLSAYLIYVKGDSVRQPSVTGGQGKVSEDMPPGGNKAVLTLSGGEQIVLDSVHAGLLAQQDGSDVSKSDSGGLVYRWRAEREGAAAGYNTLATPRGGQYQLTLADGTRVWLNAASTLRYPTAFTGDERRVELEGEAYFDVAKNVKQPFIVSYHDIRLQVLGTEFNVMAYGDEPEVQTTLVEGRIRLEDGSGPVELSPGKMAGWKGHGFTVAPADVQQVTAWRYGEWSFNRLDIRVIMRQLARWYDVDIAYEGKVPDMVFGGVIRRSVSLSTVLKFLRQEGVHFRQEGRRITLLP